MAHTLQERYSSMVLAKLRKELVTRDNYIFNNTYEGDPKAGKVKIPVRAEVNVKDYDKANGLKGETGSTTYKDLIIDKDKAVNEVIDGYDATAVPDGIVADRLDSAGYSLASIVDKESIYALETKGTVLETKTALTKKDVFGAVLEVGAKMTRAGVPTRGRWLIVSPELKTLLLRDPEFIKQGDISQQLVAEGAFGQIGGFTCFESANTMFENTSIVGSHKTTTEFIAGHPLFASRVMEFSVPVHLQDLSGSGTFIGASAVQGRLVYGVDVPRPEAIFVKRTEASV